VFEAFWQAADHTTRAAGGQGLGLYICKNLAELLGGCVWLASSSREGSVFKLRLPLSATTRISSRGPATDLYSRAIRR
jgi:signal transduction histidine kinase